MTREQVLGLGKVAERALCHGRMKKFAPAQIVAARNVFVRFTNCHFRNCFHDPLEICLTDRSCFCIRRRITKIYRDRHAVAHGELDRV